MAPIRPAATADRLLRLAGSALARADADALAEAVAAAYTEFQLLEALAGDRDTERAVAALALGLRGHGPRVEAALHRLLRGSAGTLRQVAEHALWTLWLRGNGGPGAAAFSAGLAAAAGDRPGDAAGLYAEAIDRDPGFAEAHHQLALTRSERGDLRGAASGFADAIRSKPGHFGALAGAGHTAARRGDLRAAERHYRSALGVHPGLAGVATALGAVREVLATRGRRAAG